MDFNVVVTTPLPADIEYAATTLINSLRVASPTIAAELERLVRARTPRRTGALRESISSKAYPGLVSGKRPVSLVKLYAEDGPQLDEWNRIYVGYQEYLPLGQSTYTPQKAQMFYRVSTDDLTTIEAWARDTINAAIIDMNLAPQVVETGENNRPFTLNLPMPEGF